MLFIDEILWKFGRWKFFGWQKFVSESFSDDNVEIFLDDGKYLDDSLDDESFLDDSLVS